MNGYQPYKEPMDGGQQYYPPSHHSHQAAPLGNTDGADSAMVPSRNEKGSYQPPPYVARPDQQQNNFAHGPTVPQPIGPPPQMNPPYHGVHGPPAQQNNNPPAYNHPPHQIQSNPHYGPPPPPQNNPPYGQAPHQIQPNNPQHYGPPPPPNNPHYGPPPPPNNPYNHGYQYNGLPPPVQQGYGPLNDMPAPVAGPGVTEAPKPRTEEVKTNIRLSLFCCIGWILLCALPAIPFGICALAFSYSSVRLRQKNQPQLELAAKRGRYAKYASIIAGVVGAVWGVTFFIFITFALPILVVLIAARVI